MEETRKILLVDDNENDVELILASLEEFNIVNHVIVAQDGAEATDFLNYRNKYEKREKGDPVLILLDIKMPKKDGIEVLKEIKNHPNQKNIPVVMLTSSGMESDIRECYKLGANAYVVKPVNFSDFTKTIKNTGIFWILINNTAD